MTETIRGTAPSNYLSFNYFHKYFDFFVLKVYFSIGKMISRMTPRSLSLSIPFLAWLFILYVSNSFSTQPFSFISLKKILVSSNFHFSNKVRVAIFSNLNCNSCNFPNFLFSIIKFSWTLMLHRGTFDSLQLTSLPDLSWRLHQRLVIICSSTLFLSSNYAKKIKKLNFIFKLLILSLWFSKTALYLFTNCLKLLRNQPQSCLLIVSKCQGRRFRMSREIWKSKHIFI